MQGPEQAAVDWATVENVAVRVTNERARELIALRLLSPKRGEPCAVIQSQHNTDALPLFAVAAQPTLF